MTEDEKYMYRCLQLAQNGRCTTAPNPMVGAVIVHKGRIIGEGYHVHCGEGHAEVNAIRSVKHPELLAEATIYVSLEPCSHYGKTPPCADLIISKRIPRVVVGCVDPFPLVGGRGIQKLRKAGIQVTVGVLEEACRQLIRRFVTFNLLHRPYITLKWAQSADGLIDVCRQGGRPVVLSTPLTSMLVHKLRAESDAILVGRRTALLDDPSLTTRYWYGKNPVRLLIDKDLTLPSGLRLLDGTVPTLVFTRREGVSRPGVTFVRLDWDKDILPQLLDELYRRRLQTLLVEGGSRLLQTFIDGDYWDEVRVEHSPLRLGEGVTAPVLSGQYFQEELACFGRNVTYCYHRRNGEMSIKSI